MSQADWKEFRNGNSFGTDPYLENNNVVSVVEPDNTIIRTRLDASGVIPKIWGRTYIGPDFSNFPTKYCSISMAARGSISNMDGRWGPFITPNLIGDDGHFQTPTPDADIDGIFCGFDDEFTSISRQLKTRRIANGSLVSGNEQSSPEYINDINSSGWKQFEVSFLLDDLVPGQEDFRIMYRWNQTGSTFLTPGSVGWTSWRDLATYDYATELIGASIDLSNGFYVGFGFYVGSTLTEWYGTNGVEYDRVLVTNYTEVSP